MQKLVHNCGLTMAAIKDVLLVEQGISDKDPQNIVLLGGAVIIYCVGIQRFLLCRIIRHY